jgi:rSAM/selenodomain-associated transferase 1
MNGASGDARAVVLMAKRPAAGVTKTRLVPALSPQQAADLYECFLLDTVDTIKQRTDCTLVIAIEASASAPYFAAAAPGVMQVEQRGETLGERLDVVMSACLDAGFTQVFALGSDSPDLPSGHLDVAFAALDRSETDVVFGPSDDGGYYLIGWKKRWPRIVTDVTMSTPQVLADTLEIARELDAAVELAPTWYDIDELQDLDRLRGSLAGGSLAESIGSRTAAFLTVQLPSFL